MEKKIFTGNIAVVLGIMCIVFVAGLGGTIASYTSIISSKDSANQNYVSTHSHDNTDYNSLQGSLNDYMQTHTYTDSQYDEYAASHQYTNQEYDSAVAAPKLATADVNTWDEWTNLPYAQSVFIVSGYVVNAGSDTAYNPKIHVVGYLVTNDKVLDGYITLDTMNGGSWTTFESSFEYTGGPLFYWTITPQWTTTP
jgi:hypothetical protein